MSENKIGTIVRSDWEVRSLLVDIPIHALDGKVIKYQAKALIVTALVRGDRIIIIGTEPHDGEPPTWASYADRARVPPARSRAVKDS